MGKRLKRIFRKQLQQEQNNFLGRVVNVVLHNATTLHGVAQALEREELQVLDIGKHLHRLPLKQITEVVVDFEAPY